MVEAQTKFKYCQKFFTGEEIPAIGYGTYQLKNKDCQIGVKIALQTGYRHIDTASIYKNEKDIKIGIADFISENPNFKREDLFITSKVAPAE